MTDLINKLTEVFNTNFVVYTRSHIAHLNITGRNFYSDHKLLNKIYDSLQADIDNIGEQLRTLGATAPESLGEIVDGSVVKDDMIFGMADELLETVLTDITALTALYRELEELAEEDDEDQISNFAQDRETTLTKFAWMLRSTLEG
jgi:starvation-inducible DNA-binding protein